MNNSNNCPPEKQIEYFEEAFNKMLPYPNRHIAEDAYNVKQMKEMFYAGANWQKEQIINKACEWLRKHILEYFDDAGVEISTFTENFMTALEDEQ